MGSLFHNQAANPLVLAELVEWVPAHGAVQVWALLSTPVTRNVPVWALQGCGPWSLVAYGALKYLFQHSLQRTNRFCILISRHN